MLADLAGGRFLGGYAYAELVASLVEELPDLVDFVSVEAGVLVEGVLRQGALDDAGEDHVPKVGLGGPENPKQRCCFWLEEVF